MKDIDKFKKLFYEIGQDYIERVYHNSTTLCSGEGGWDCCNFEFDKDGKFIEMYTDVRK